jgi:hypothetical protein
VAIVSRNNEIKLTFRAVSIQGPKMVTLADGKNWPKGYVIRSDKRTLTQLRHSVISPVGGWYATGAFRYFNASNMRAVLIGDHIDSSRDYIENAKSNGAGLVFRPHFQGIPGLPRQHPEAMLVDEYVSWMNQETRFGHNYIREAGLFVDLFDLTHWQLLEAKATLNREALRMAIGQLRDYKRYYQGRRPSLAVLLPSRPSEGRIKLMTDNRITVIWRTREGRFSSRRWREPLA